MSSYKPYQPNRPIESEELDRILNPEFFRLLGEPVRLELMKLLAKLGPSDITTIAGHFNKDRSVISKHLKALYEADMVIRYKDARSTIYKVHGFNFLKQLESITLQVRTLLNECFPEEFETHYPNDKTSTPNQ